MRGKEMTVHKHSHNRELTGAYIGGGVYFSPDEDELLHSSFIFYPTKRTKDGMKTYIDYCNRENRKALVLPRW
jgi:hypothetical protein